MTEIPGDVMNTALIAAGAIETEAYGSDEDGGYFNPYEAAEIIARAILAEREAQRERDAKIADDCVFDEHALAQATEYGMGAHATASDIAAAIRKG